MPERITKNVPSRRPSWTSDRTRGDLYVERRAGQRAHVHRADRGENFHWIWRRVHALSLSRRMPAILRHFSHALRLTLGHQRRGARYWGGVSDIRTGLRVRLTSPPSSRAIETVGSSPSERASSNAWPTSLTTPAGTRASVRRGAHSLAGRPAAAEPRAASLAEPRGWPRDRRWWSNRDRRASSVHAEHLAQRAELAVVADRQDAARHRRSPTAHRGRCSGARCPSAAGTTPAIVYADPWLTSAPSSADSRLTSTSWPSPLASRWRSGGKDPDRRKQPGEHVDDRDAHLLRLRRRASPVMLISPPSACTSRS